MTDEEEYTEDAYVKYMCDLYEDINGKRPSQDWIDALRKGDDWDE